MRTYNRHKTITWIAVAFLIILLSVLYRCFNPLDYSFFPKCPFLTLTGLKCPGCGSQRAIHHLLNFQIVEAFKVNALLVISFPFLIILMILNLGYQRSSQLLMWRNHLYSKHSIFVILVIIINFWVFRNILSF